MVQAISACPGIIDDLMTIAGKLKKLKLVSMNLLMA